MPEETRTVGYICPVCGQPVIAGRTAFQLAAGNSTLPCPCGKSELHFTQLGDRCEITVPCLFCAKDHTAVCSTGALLRQKLLALSCPASGLGVCFIGGEAPVFRAMEKLEQAVDKLRQNEQSETRGAFLNEAVMGEVLAELRDIAARKGVGCGCGSTDYGVRVGFSSVDVVCARCGAALRLPAATHDDLDALCARYTVIIPSERNVREE